MKAQSLVLLSLIFIGCNATSLVYTNQKIHLQNETHSYTFTGKTLEKKQKNLSKISIEQNIFENEYNELLVYEYARLSTGHKFKYSYAYILNHIFNAKTVIMKKDEKGLGFFIITLRSNEKVYTLVKTGTKKSLTMVYGLSEENFFALINQKKLRVQKNIQRNRLIKSAWNETLVITGVLLEKEGGRAFNRH